MSASTTAHSPSRHAPSLAAFWLVILFLVAIGVALAWFATGSMRGETYPSGLVIRTVEEGSGDPVGLQDGVLIEYEGRLADGSVFESTAGRGPVPLILAQAVPGFAEALTHMQKGGMYRIHIPSELAYGSSPPPSSPIPANADLDFDIHVVEVARNVALQMGPPPARPQDAGPQAEGANQPSE